MLVDELEECRKIEKLCDFMRRADFTEIAVSVNYPRGTRGTDGKPVCDWFDGYDYDARLLPLTRPDGEDFTLQSLYKAVAFFKRAQEEGREVEMRVKQKR